MDYIIASLHFVIASTKQSYFFSRENFVDGILAQDVFNEICQYLTELTNTPAPTLNDDLNTNQVINALMSYSLSIGYTLCTNFENHKKGWTTQPYTEEENPKEEENL